MASQILDKLEAACRQLNTAITLWFNDGDAVSIHTLAFSAHQIVHDINRHRGGRDLLYDSLIIKDEYRREAITCLKKHYNFFKHADNDPEETIEFDPTNTEFFIFFTSFALEGLGCGPDEVRGAFNIYFAVRYPNLLTEKGKAQFIDPFTEETRKDVLNLPKHRFFEEYIRLRRNRLVGPTIRPRFR